MKKFFIVLIAIALMGSFFTGCNDQVQDMQYKELYTGAPGTPFTGPTTLDPALYESEIRLMYQPIPATLTTPGTAYEFSRSLSKDGKTGSLLVTKSSDTLTYSGWTKTVGAEKIKKEFTAGFNDWDDVLTAVLADIANTGEAASYPTDATTPALDSANYPEAHYITVAPVVAGKPTLTFTFTQKHTLQVTALYKYTGAFE